MSAITGLDYELYLSVSLYEMLIFDEVCFSDLINFQPAMNSIDQPVQLTVSCWWVANQLLLQFTARFTALPQFYPLCLFVALPLPSIETLAILWHTMMVQHRRS